MSSWALQRRGYAFSTHKNMAEKRKKTYHFHSEWEKEFFFTNVKENCVCLICGATVATAKRHNVERHFSTCHKSNHANYPPGSALRTEKARELKAALGKQQSFFTCFYCVNQPFLTWTSLRTNTEPASLMHICKSHSELQCQFTSQITVHWWRACNARPPTNKKNKGQMLVATCQCHGKDKLKYWNTVTDVSLSVTDVIDLF